MHRLVAGMIGFYDLIQRNFGATRNPSTEIDAKTVSQMKVRVLPSALDADVAQWQSGVCKRNFSEVLGHFWWVMGEQCDGCFRLLFGGFVQVATKMANKTLCNFAGD